MSKGPGLRSLFWTKSSTFPTISEFIGIFSALDQELEDEERKQDTQEISDLKNALAGMNLGGGKKPKVDLQNEESQDIKGKSLIPSDTPLNTQIDVLHISNLFLTKFFEGLLNLLYSENVSRLSGNSYSEAENIVVEDSEFTLTVCR